MNQHEWLIHRGFHHHQRGGAGLIVATLVAVVVGLAFIGSMAVMAAAMIGGMSGMPWGMSGMHGGGSQAPQTPVVSDALQVTVEIRDFDFFPRELTVKTGTTVTWVNRDAVPHDATDEAEGWGTGKLGRSESATLAFESPGRYQYFCTIHPDMKATLTVQ